ncbi:MAG: hypothetical protein CMM86_09430 [Rhodovulum sp.]|nr:hypothetical protein [Rhodovulum sp.]|tara:strand:- start:733 stop:1314 length:582 start_codon:yes stop_codon:yes gene_type:complete
MKTDIIALSDPNFDARKYLESLKIRREFFVDGLQWDLPTVGEWETDQYDNLHAYHIILSDDGQVIGSMRLLPTTAKIFNTTYMIQDGNRGHLPGIPAGILPHEIQDPKTWEASRLALRRTVEPRHRNTAIRAIINAAETFITDRGGNQMLGLMDPIWERSFNRMGFNVTRIGPVETYEKGRMCVLSYTFSLKS